MSDLDFCVDKLSGEYERFLRYGRLDRFDKGLLDLLDECGGEFELRCRTGVWGLFALCFREPSGDFECRRGDFERRRGDFERRRDDLPGE